MCNFKQLHAQEAFIDIPTAFSPDGDGINDKLKIVANNVDEIEFRIYNRWGNLVFETDDINKEWDGTYKKQPVEIGAYVYYVKVKTILGETLWKTGNITVIR